VCHISENPPDTWQGERGFISGDWLTRYLPVAPEQFEYYLCGPTAMTTMVEKMPGERDTAAPYPLETVQPRLIAKRVSTMRLVFARILALATGILTLLLSALFAFIQNFQL